MFQTKTGFCVDLWPNLHSLWPGSYSLYLKITYKLYCPGKDRGQIATYFVLLCVFASLREIILTTDKHRSTQIEENTVCPRNTRKALKKKGFLFTIHYSRFTDYQRSQLSGLSLYIDTPLADAAAGTPVVRAPDTGARGQRAERPASDEISADSRPDKYQSTRYSQLSTFGLTFQICEMC